MDFGVSTNIAYIWGYFYVIYGIFLRSMYRIVYYLGLLKFKIFLSVPNILIFLRDKQEMLGSSLRIEKKLRAIPPFGKLEHQCGKIVIWKKTQPCPTIIKLCSCSTQLCMKLVMFVNVKCQQLLAF